MSVFFTPALKSVSLHVKTQVMQVNKVDEMISEMNTIKFMSVYILWWKWK